ncbi:domain-containing CRADD [Octopus vulgaris]|uniref:Domain-containing CRADD n=1 Tax=Octopus vulgaris TaxID=6645 RepID=A0AA36FG69_OCTVU|nr:domain-containing CRADD [Octopus vulgaris]
MANKQQLRNSIKIQKCQVVLVDGLDGVTVTKIVDHFLSQLVINDEEKNAIQAKETEQEKARKLLDVIRPKVKSQDKENKSELFNGFVECLEKHNSSLASKVENADDSVPNDELDIDNILERVKNIDLNEKMLNRILMRMGSGWESVASELGIESIKIDNVRQDNPYSTHNQKFEAFNSWRKKQAHGRGALTKLIKAIYYCSVNCNVNMNKILECIEDP